MTNRPYDYQFTPGFQALAEVCNRNGIPAYFGLTPDQKYCTVVDDRIAVVPEGDGVRVLCKKADQYHRNLVDRIGNTVKSLMNQGYSFAS